MDAKLLVRAASQKSVPIQSPMCDYKTVKV